MNNSYNNESIQKKCEDNKFFISTKGRIKKFLQARKKKELDQKLNILFLSIDHYFFFGCI